MSTFSCHFFQRLQRYPKVVLLCALAATLFAALELSKLGGRPSVGALFGQGNSGAAPSSMLIAVVRGEDGEANLRAMRSLEEKIGAMPGIRLALHRTDSAFLARNWLYYVDVDDLERVRDEARAAAERLSARANPFVVPLSEGDTALPWNLKRIREASLPVFVDHVGSRDGKIAAMYVLPEGDVSGIREADALFRAIDSAVRAELPPGSEVHYTGDVAEASASAAILDRIPAYVLVAGATVLLLLLLFFKFQLRMVLLSVVPSSMALLWTLALAHRALHSVTLLTALLSVFFFAVGVEIETHMLGRYQEERLKGMGPKLSMETLLLETGPGIVLGCLVWAVCAFSLCFVEMRWVADFGRIGGFCILSQTVAVLLVFPAMLQLAQSRRPFRVRGTVRHNIRYFQRAPLRGTGWMAGAIAVVLAASFGSGMPITFEKRLEAFGLAAGDTASALMDEAQIVRPNPILVEAEDAESCERAKEALKGWMKKNRLVKRFVVHSGQLQLSDVREKEEIFDELREILRDPMLEKMPPEARDLAKQFLARLPGSAPSEEMMPPEIRRVAALQDRNTIVMLPDFPPGDGRKAAALVRSLEPLADGLGVKLGGSPVAVGRFVERTLPALPRIWTATVLLVLLLLWFELGLRAALFEILLPVLVGAVPTVAWIYSGPAGLNPVNAPLMPLAVGLVVCAVINVQHRHREEGPGSLPFVLRTTGVQTAFSMLVACAVFAPLFLFPGAYVRSVAGTLVASALGAIFAADVAAPFVLSLRERIRSRMQED